MARYLLEEDTIWNAPNQQLSYQCTQKRSDAASPAACDGDGEGFHSKLSAQPSVSARRRRCL